MNKMIVFDVPGIVFRSYYGMPTNTKTHLQNFFYIFNKIITSFEFDYLILCFDKNRNSFRKSIFPQYKENRQKLEVALIENFIDIKKKFCSMGFHCLEYESYEADDIIATIVNNFYLETVVVSNDKDLNQILKPRVKIYNHQKKKICSKETFIEENGIDPFNYIDLLSLCGDRSDNVPGVRGIGPKIALELIKEYKTVENIYDNLDRIRDRYSSMLVKGKSEAFLSKKLVTLNSEVPMNLNIENFYVQKNKIESDIRKIFM